MKIVLFTLFLILGFNAIDAQEFVWTSRTKLPPLLALINCTSLLTSLGIDYTENPINFPDLGPLTISLYTTATAKTVYNLTLAAPQLLSASGFDKTKQTVIVMNGWMEDDTKPQIKQQMAALKTVPNINVLNLGTLPLLNDPLYFQSSQNAVAIGQLLGNVLKELVQGGVDPAKVHLVGFSLGAHISGIAARVFTSLSPGSKIGRITGLDPAGPCIFNSDTAASLRKSDATMVDVIHTCSNELGTPAAIGSIDFFPNNGELQTSCFTTTCNHERARVYFSESISSSPTKKYLAVLCPNYYRLQDGTCTNNARNVMGYYTTATPTGQFFSRTALFSPYGAGENGINKSPLGIFGMI